MLTEYRVDPQVTKMMDEITWIVVPLLNVDGYEYSWTDVSTITQKDIIKALLSYRMRVEAKVIRNTVYLLIKHLKETEIVSLHRK